MMHRASFLAVPAVHRLSTSWALDSASRGGGINLGMRTRAILLFGLLLVSGVGRSAASSAFQWSGSCFGPCFLSGCPATDFHVCNGDPTWTGTTIHGPNPGGTV